MGKVAIAKGALSEMYDWLNGFLKTAPRDRHGRIPLQRIKDKEFENLLNLPPDAPNGLVFRGEPGAPTNEHLTYVAKWPKHALNYAAGDYGTTKNPYGFLSVYDVPWNKLPGLDAEANEVLVLRLLAHRTKPVASPNIPKDIVESGGVRMFGIPDFALGPNGAMDDAFEHMQPQGLIWDKQMLQRKAKGGLIQMKECGCK